MDWLITYSIDSFNHLSIILIKLIKKFKSFHYLSKLYMYIYGIAKHLYLFSVKIKSYTY